MIIEYQQLDTEIDIQPETIPDNEKLKDMPLVFHQSIRIELREEDADFTDLKVVELLLIILSLLLGVLVGPQYILISLEYVCEKYVDFISVVLAELLFVPLLTLCSKTFRLSLKMMKIIGFLYIISFIFLMAGWVNFFFGQPYCHRK